MTCFSSGLISSVSSSLPKAPHRDSDVLFARLITVTLDFSLHSLITFSVWKQHCFLNRSTIVRQSMPANLITEHVKRLANILATSFVSVTKIAGLWSNYFSSLSSKLPFMLSIEEDIRPPPKERYRRENSSTFVRPFVHHCWLYHWEAPRPERYSCSLSESMKKTRPIHKQTDRTLPWNSSRFHRYVPFILI